MSANQNSGSSSGSASAEGRGRARFRAVPTRTVMVFPTRDGDHITVTISIGPARPAPARRVRFAPNFEAVQTPEDRVFRRVRNTMAGMLNAALDRRVRSALGRLSEAELRQLDESTDRLGLVGDRVVQMERD